MTTIFMLVPPTTVIPLPRAPGSFEVDRAAHRFVTCVLLSWAVRGAAGVAFDRPDGGEEAAEADLFALDVRRIEEPLPDRGVEDRPLGLAALGRGQLGRDGALEVA
jgi:hypothetical protein